MFFLAKDLPVLTIFLISVSFVIATRITSYYNEDLAKDMGKLVPFALLAIFLASPTFFSFDLVRERVSQLPSFAVEIAQFVVFAMTVEAVLRIIYLIVRRVRGEKALPQQDKQ